MKRLKKISVSDIRFSLDEAVLKPKEQIKRHSLDQIKIKELKEDFKTKYNFLKAHKGFQRGHTHVFLGRTNKGKSALVQSLACENIVNGYKTLLFLSEGEKGDVKRRFDTMLSLKYKSIEERNHIMRRLILIDESDLDQATIYDPQSWVASLFKFVKEYEIDLAYIDNFSTCSFGDSSPEIQANFMKTLCATTQRYQIALIGVVHQAKSVAPDKELTIEDIRANSAFMNSPSFVYALNNFCHFEDQSKRVLSILKSRLDGDIIGNYYDLSYKKYKNEGFYVKDQQIDNKIAKELFFRNKSQRFSTKSFQKSW
ncbi:MULTISPECIES: ATPase domain-containing protein [unclassified Halobacteriovorax]|uniref:ATPase domain-containing protein n=1 Tax=unclassified Halobacteriovorax TaxID=2639665 RepID=UPI00399AB15E